MEMGGEGVQAEGEVMNLYRVEVVAETGLSPAAASEAPTRKLYVLARTLEQAMLLGRAKYSGCKRIRVVEFLAESGQIVVPSPEQLDWVCAELQ